MNRICDGKAGLLLTAFVAMLVHTSAVAAPKNFIIIFTDDQGYGDLGCFGSPKVKTPHIDQLANEGMKLTSFYSASSVCSPSRAALLTGRMPKRAGVPAVLFPYSQTGLPEKEITIAELLKTKGYATALVGKWHLGHLKQFLPTNQGFDSYFGVPYSNDMSIAKELAISPNIKLADGWDQKRLQADIAKYQSDYRSMKDIVPLMRDEQIIEYPVDQREITRRYAEEAVKFIGENKDKPFFLYLAHTMPHTPLFTSKAFEGKTGHGVYNDSLAEIDWSVGEVMKALKKHQLDKNTFVIYTSDNGPSGWQQRKRRNLKHNKRIESGNLVLRGAKFTTFEGGHRVPTVAWAPGTIPAGKVCDEMASTLDMLPTLAHWAGAELPGDRTYDSYNLAGLLSGKVDKSPRNEMYFYTPNTETIDGIRVGDFKYLIKGLRKVKKVSPMLFNVRQDKEEKSDLIKSHAEMAEVLKKKMLDFDATSKKW